MKDKLKIIASPIAFNEEGKIGNVVKKIPKSLVDLILVVDDYSTDNTRKEAESQGAVVITHKERKGVGAGIRTAIDYAIENKYDIIVIMAGNDKDNPQEISRLIDPIINEGYDFIQGSRFLKGGYYGNMPFYRILATKLHPLIFSILVGARLTESTNGFRAFKTSLFNDKRINLWQDWLNSYELEPYLYYKVIKCGYKWKEVPVTKIYPQKGTTKMVPFKDWWRILKPLFCLWLGIKK
ncbi:MAG: glycosyltransferase family 2 protein [bacterium]